MNIFRFIADMLHLSAILVLLYRIRKSRNCIGKYLKIDRMRNRIRQIGKESNGNMKQIDSGSLVSIWSGKLFMEMLTNLLILGLSCRTQEVYLLVFLVRYADLFMYYVSAYNTMMKIFFISSTAFIIYLMRFKKPFCSVSTGTMSALSKRSKWHAI